MKSKAFIYISLTVDLVVATVKFIAAAFTGSASMLSEGIHSVIDAISQVLLLWGIKSSQKKPDEDRPFGYGKEFYFWSFIVSLVLFILGGCISFYEGLNRLRNPMFDHDPTWSYSILCIAFAFTLVSMFATLRTFNRQRGDLSFWKAAIATKDPSTIIVLLGDIGDLVGLFIAFLGVYLSIRFHNPYLDGIASMIIGVILVIISWFLLRESKSLLMGEPTSRKTLMEIVRITEADEAVVKVKKHFSMYMAPEEILLHLNVAFKDTLTTNEIIAADERISRQIRAQFPRIKQIFIEVVPA